MMMAAPYAIGAYLRKGLTERIRSAILTIEGARPDNTVARFCIAEVRAWPVSR